MKKIFFLFFILSFLYCENVIIKKDYKFLYREKYFQENNQLYCIYVMDCFDKKIYAIYNFQKIENFNRNQVLTKNTVIGESSDIKMEEVGSI